MYESSPISAEINTHHNGRLSKIKRKWFKEMVKLGTLLQQNGLICLLKMYKNF